MNIIIIKCIKNILQYFCLAHFNQLHLTVMFLYRTVMEMCSKEPAQAFLQSLM